MSQTSLPVNLGSIGLVGGSLIFQAYLQATPTSVAVPVDSSGIVTTPLLDFSGDDTFNYQLSGLPDPVSGGIGTVIISLASTGIALREYWYSLPSPSLLPVSIYRADTVVSPNNPITSADTIGVIQLTVSGMPDPSSATVTFNGKTVTDQYVLQSRPAAISNIAPILTGTGAGGYSFTLSYVLEPGHPIIMTPNPPISTTALMYGEFHLDYGDGLIKCLPSDNSLTVRVRKSFS